MGNHAAAKKIVELADWPSEIGPLSDDAIRHLVDSFYAKVRADSELGPIFKRAIPGDWGLHLATMHDFWSSIMLTSGRYKGNPVAVHLRVEGMEPQLFGRWLALFAETCRELERIAESLKLALFYRPDRPWQRSAPRKQGRLKP